MESIHLLFICLLVSSVSLGQRRDTILITPGHAILQSRELHQYKASFDFFSYKDGIETKVGGLDDSFTILSKGKETQGLRICHITFGANTILDSGLCSLQSLQPIYHRSIQTKKKISLDFNGKVVSGSIGSTVDGENKNELVNYHAAAPLFDSYYEDILAKAIRFDKGLLFKFPEYIYERGGLVWSYGEVLGKENFQNEKEKIVAWKVIFYEKNSAGETIRTTTYLVNQANRQIISREYKTDRGRMIMKPSKA